MSYLDGLNRGNNWYRVTVYDSSLKRCGYCNKEIEKGWSRGIVSNTRYFEKGQWFSEPYIPPIYCRKCKIYIQKSEFKYLYSFEQLI